MSSRTQVLSLYRSLLRTSKGFVNYNFREYALRHVRESFASARGATGEEAANLYQAGLEQHKGLLSERKGGSFPGRTPPIGGG